jgi:hypothetical protein
LIFSTIFVNYFREALEKRDRQPVALTDELFGADPAPAAVERLVGTIGGIERAVRTGADINAALSFAKRPT